MYMRDRGESEVGGFGITRADDLLFIEDFVTVKQEVSPVTVSFDDTAVADFFDIQSEQGLLPQQFARMWIHTHPGNSATPSSVDEETFARVFGNCDFSIMFILARGGQYYSRINFSNPSNGWAELPVEVDFAKEFQAADHEAWEAEFLANVKEHKAASILDSWGDKDFELSLGNDAVDDYLEQNMGYTRRELMTLTHEEKQIILNDFESEVFEYE
jgi:proteasome lid subunit RPN8/RPN11